ncbi:MAG: hypothetical protein ABI835_17835, partial [Chloroflexota bacterium]
QTGAFRIGGAAEAAVSVTGDGLAALWTRRALERAGFAIATNGGATMVRVEVTPGRWRLIHDEQREDYASVYALIEAIGQI